MKISLLLLSACALSHAATYTWTGAAADGDWNNAANWDGGSIGQTDYISASNGAPDTIIFNGSAMPTSNLPSFGGALSSHVLFQFNSGGSYTLDYSSAYNDGPIYGTSTAQNFITVGDGSGIVADVTVNLTNYTTLLRHSGAAHTIVVNSDGVLNLAAVSTYVNNGRTSNFLINGGSVVASSYVHTSYGMSNTGVTAAFMTFTEEGSSFTAAYGSQFADLAEVEADAQNIFRSSLGYGGFEYTDNGSTFTITLVPEPTAVTLLGLGGLALVARRKR